MKKKVARGWERKKENRDTYQEILEAAARAFSKNGYDGTSLAEIASAVGIKTPALYYHFKSKNELLYAYLIRSTEPIMSAIDKATSEAPDDAVSQLKAYVRAYVQVQLEMIDTMPTINAMVFNPALSKVLTRSQYRWVKEWERNLIGMLRSILEKGRKNGDFAFGELAPTAFFLMGSIDFVVNWFDPKGSLSIEALADDYARMAVASVSKGSA